MTEQTKADHLEKLEGMSPSSAIILAGDFNQTTPTLSDYKQ